jgi:hypothetical protein
MNQINQSANLRQLLLANLVGTSGFGVYSVMPMSILGSIFNLISLVIFLKKDFRTISLFKYMQIYTWASLTVTVAFPIGFLFFDLTHFYNIAISYMGRFYRCYFITSFETLFFFFTNALEIFFNVERAVTFSNNHQSYKKQSAYTICFITFIVCLIVNVPSNLNIEIVAEDLIFVLLKLCKTTSFGQSSHGKILLFISYFIQGPLILILAIASAITSFVCFQMFLKKKSELNGTMTRVNTDNIENDSRKQRTQDKKEKNLLRMTLYLTLFSVIVHTVQFTTQVVTFIFTLNASLSTIFATVYGILIISKLSTNIFFFYKFNSSFRNALKKYISKKKSKSSNEISLPMNPIGQTTHQL